MKKNDQDKTSFKSDISSNKDLSSDKFKTTNVNILLNRVRLDRKKTVKKRILFFLALSIFISSLIVFLRNNKTLNLVKLIIDLQSSENFAFYIKTF